MKAGGQVFQKLTFGISLAALWLAGLFLVLEAESLLIKSLVLIVLAPLSLELDRLVSRLICPRARKADFAQQSPGKIKIGHLQAAREISHEERLVA